MRKLKTGMKIFYQTINPKICLIGYVRGQDSYGSFIEWYKYNSNNFFSATYWNDSVLDAYIVNKKCKIINDDKEKICKIYKQKTLNKINAKINYNLIEIKEQTNNYNSRFIKKQNIVLENLKTTVSKTNEEHKISNTIDNYNKRNYILCRNEISKLQLITKPTQELNGHILWLNNKMQSTNNEL